MNNNFLDITEESCPYTIVKVKVAISDIEQGEILEILMDILLTLQIQCPII